MRITGRWWVGLAVACGVAFGAGAIAVAASSGTSGAALPRVAGIWLLDQSASYLGLTPARLRTDLVGQSLADVAGSTSGKSVSGLEAALTAAVDQKLAAAVTAGKITATREQKLESGFSSRLPGLVNRVWLASRAHARVALAKADLLKTAASYLGLTPARLRTDLAGTSLADVAGSTSGKSVSGLEAALTAAVNQKLAAAVTAGKITATREQKLESGFSSRLPGLVNRVWPASRAHPRVALAKVDLLKTAASYLGLTPARLRTDLAGTSLADVAGSTSGKSVSGLEAALTAAVNQKLAAAVTAGKITATREQKLESGFSSRLPGLVNRVWPASGAHPRVALAEAVLFKTAASYLGLTPARLRTDLVGTSLADVAGSTSGKSVSGLEAALTAAVNQKLAAAVTAGKITAVQEQKVESTFSSRLPGLINRTWGSAPTATV